MKKGEVPQLSSKWWEKNKAKTLLNTGLGAALRVYEAKKERFDWDGVLDALKDVDAAAKKAVSKCSDTLHKETKECLQKFPGVIKKEAEEAKKKKSEEEKKKQEKGSEVAKQKIGSPEVLWARSIGEEFTKKYAGNFPWLKSLQAGMIELKVNSDMQKTLLQEGDQVIAMRMIDTCNKLFWAALEDLKKDAEGVENAEEKVMIAEFTSTAKNAGTILAKQIAAVPKREWDKYIAKKKQYKDYKVQVAINATIGGLKAVGSGLALAAAVPTGGASLAFGIIGAFNSVMDIAKQCRDGFQEAETVIKRMAKNLKTMSEEFEDTKKQAAAKAKLVGGTIANTILAFPVLPTIKTVSDDYSLADNKAAGLNVKAVALGKGAMKVMDKIDALDDLLSKSKDKKAVAKAQKQIVELRKKVSSLFDETHAMGERVSATEDALEGVKELIDEVKQGAGKYITAFERIFPAVYNVAMGLANAGVGFAEAKSALEFANTGIGLANDLLLEVKNQVEAGEG